MEEQRAAEQILKELGVLKTGHFVYTSGRHGYHYVAKTNALPNVMAVHDLCGMIADELRAQEVSVDVVVGPAMGAITLAHALAFELSTVAKVVQAIRVDKQEDGSFAFPYDWADRVADKNVVVVEDILTTGKTTRLVVDAILNAGGMPVATGALWNRGSLSAEHVASALLISTVNKSFGDFAEDECPLCADKVPINTDFGHGEAYLAQGGSW